MNQETQTKIEKRIRIVILSIILILALAGIITVIVYREAIFGNDKPPDQGSTPPDRTLYSNSQLTAAMAILGVSALFPLGIIVYQQTTVKKMTDVVSLHDGNTTIRYLLDVSLGLGFISAILATSAGIPDFSPAKRNMPSNLYLLPWVFTFVIAAMLCIIILVKGRSLTLTREVSNMLFFLLTLGGTIAAILTCDLNGTLTFLSIMFTVISGLIVLYTGFIFFSGDAREIRRDEKFDAQVPEAAMERVAKVITGDGNNDHIPEAETVFEENLETGTDLGSVRTARNSVAPARR
jgi:hypothetical protein